VCPDSQVPKSTFTRDEILAALTVRPCHITGIHNPDHHRKYTCADQRAEAFRQVLELIGATEDELPRALHNENCGWCHRIPSQERYREDLRKTWGWAGVPLTDDLAAPAPDAPVFDVTEDDVMAAMDRAEKVAGDWVRTDALREALGLPRHTPRYSRPAHRLVEAGRLEFRNGYEAGHSGQYRVTPASSTETRG
jgi:hypothetical protein